MGVAGFGHHTHRRLLSTVLLVGAFAVAAGGCGAQVATPPPTASTETTPEPTGTPTPNPLFETTVPPELAGTWRRSVDGQRVDLSLQVGYSIQRGPGRGTGRVTVDGDRIEFHAGSLCDGIGVYTWVVEGDRLTLTMDGTDPCSGRSEVLVPGSFRRVEP